MPDIRSLSGFIGYPMFFSLSGIWPDSATIRPDIRYSNCISQLKILLLLYFDIIFLRIHYYLVVVSKFASIAHGEFADKINKDHAQCGV